MVVILSEAKNPSRLKTTKQRGILRAKSALRMTAFCFFRNL